MSSEPLAYEGIAGLAWKTLPVSGMIELSAVLVFALNLGLTILLVQSALTAQPANAPADKRACCK